MWKTDRQTFFWQMPNLTALRGQKQYTVYRLYWSSCRAMSVSKTENFACSRDWCAVEWCWHAGQWSTVSWPDSIQHTPVASTSTTSRCSSSTAVTGTYKCIHELAIATWRLLIRSCRQQGLHPYSEHAESCFPNASFSRTILWTDESVYWEYCSFTAALNNTTQHAYVRTRWKQVLLMLICRL